MRNISRAITDAFKTHCDLAVVEDVDGRQIFKVLENGAVTERSISVISIRFVRSIGTYRCGNAIHLPWAQVLATVQKLKANDSFFAGRLAKNKLWGIDLDRIFYDATSGALSIKFSKHQH